VVDEQGCELVDVEVARNRGEGLLRITVDSPQGDGRVAIERCVTISREIETLLDAAEAMTTTYRLEVSSPGLDRLLGREKDFVGALDQEIKLRTRRPLEGRKRFRGRLLGVESGASTVLRVEVDGEEVSIPFDEVEKANTIYAFSPADFDKKRGRGRG
jgi:ribosome maturation factor RimP